MNSKDKNHFSCHLKEDDYLELWKYFQTRADQLKEDMFKTITWVIGFAAAVLGFIVNKFINLDNTLTQPLIINKSLTIVFCIVGLLLCIYAGFLLTEYAKHIKRNWDRSDRCKDKIDGLDELIKGTCSCRKGTGIAIWWRIGGIIIAFSLAFLSGLFFITIS